jgi:hypothetical protein
MSQAHYVRCGWSAYKGAEHGIAVANVTDHAHRVVPVCVGCLDTWLDFIDNTYPRLEPLRIEWVYDAGTRTCPLHHWPDVVCADWGAEHAAMLRAMWPAPPERTLVRRGLEPYGDLACRLLELEQAERRRPDRG